MTEYTFHDKIRSYAVVEVFMNVTVASLTAIHAAVTGNGTLQTISASAQPDIPRNISITSTGTHGGVSTITGILATGQPSSEVITIVPGGTAYGSKAFAKVTSYTLPATLDATDTLACGKSDKLGLSKILQLATDVYKCKRNSADITVPAIDIINATINFATIVANDDFTVWYTAVV